jgi:hypothetical protein
MSLCPIVSTDISPLIESCLWPRNNFWSVALADVPDCENYYSWHSASPARRREAPASGSASGAKPGLPAPGNRARFAQELPSAVCIEIYQVALRAP